MKYLIASILFWAIWRRVFGGWLHLPRPLGMGWTELSELLAGGIFGATYWVAVQVTGGTL